MSNALIKLENINKHFNGTPILKNINLNISAGTIIALLGPSGAGKSTLLRAINLLEIPNEGRLQVGDLAFDFNHTIATKQILQLRQQVTMVFQQFYLWPHKNVLRNITLAPTVVLKVKKQVAEERALALLKKVGLENKASTYPSALSGGQQQRVAIARALAMTPKIILFDEPTASLDPEKVQGLVQTIKTLAAEGITMIIATHEMSFAQQVADRVVFLESGNIIADESPEAMFKHGKNERFKQFIANAESGSETRASS